MTFLDLINQRRRWFSGIWSFGSAWIRISYMCHIWGILGNLKYAYPISPFPSPPPSVSLSFLEFLQPTHQRAPPFPQFPLQHLPQTHPPRPPPLGTPMDSLRHSPKPLRFRFVLHHTGPRRRGHRDWGNSSARTVQCRLFLILHGVRGADQSLCDLVPAERVSCREKGLIAMTGGDAQCLKELALFWTFEARCTIDFYNCGTDNLYQNSYCFANNQTTSQIFPPSQ